MSRSMALMVCATLAMVAGCGEGEADAMRQLEAIAEEAREGEARLEAERAEHEQSLRHALAWIADEAQAEWMVVDGTRVYVGFARRPDDMDVLAEWALQGSREVNTYVQVMAVPATYGSDWHPSDHAGTIDIYGMRDANVR